MKTTRYAARINTKVLFVLVSVTSLVGAGAVGGHKIRKRLVAGEALRAGKAAVEKKDWTDAARQLKLYLSKYPDDVEMLAQYAEANLAIVPEQLQNVGTAIGAYRRMLRHRPGDARICEQLARLYMRIRDFNEAAYICRQRLQADPNDASAMIWLGKALIAQRKYDEAAQVLQGTVEKHPHQLEPYAMLSGIAMQKDTTTSVSVALQWLDRAVQANPTSAKALVHRARLHRLAKKNPEAARTDLEAAEQLRPTDPIVLLLLGEEWLQLGDLDRAEKHVRVLDAQDATGPVDPDVDPSDLTLAKFRLAASLTLRKGVDRQAAHLADRAMEELTGRKRVAFLPNAIDLYLAGDRAKDARRCLNDYREAEGSETAGKTPSSLTVLLTAKVDSADGKYYEVIGSLESLVAAGPDNVHAWMLLADAYDRTGQTRRSIRAMEESISRNPEDRPTLLRLARAYLGIDPTKADNYAAKAERIASQDIEASLLRIEARFLASAGTPGETDTRQKLFQDLSALADAATEPSEVLFLKARLCARSGRYPEAIADLEKVAAAERSLRAELMLVDLLMQTKETEEALSTCRASIARHPTAALPRIMLAGLLVAGGNGDAARDVFDQAVAQLEGEERIDAINALARHLLLHGDAEKGMNLLKQLSTDRPGDPRVRLTLLSLPEVQRDPILAQKLIDEVRRIEGDNGLRWRTEQAALWLRRETWRNRCDEITALLARCLDADPGWPHPVMLLGELNERLSRADKAEETYRQALTVNPQALDVADRLLRLLERQRRYPEARDVLTQAPANAQVLLRHRVEVAVNLGDIDPAVRAIENVIATDAGNVDARVLLAGLIYHKSRDADRALKLLDEARLAAPEMLDVSAARAAILSAEDRADEALQVLNEAVNRQNGFDACLLRARHFMDRGQIDLAEKDYIHLTTFRPQAVKGFILLGQFYQDTKRPDAAAAALEEGLRIEPTSADLQRQLTKVLLANPQPVARERGEVLLQDLLARFPDDPDLLWIRAGLLMQGQQVREAKTLMERIVAIEPHAAQVHAELIRLARAQGNANEAYQLANRAAGTNPNDPTILLLKAGLEHDLGRPAVAMQLVRSVVDSDPKRLDARNLLAQLHLADGDFAAAERQLGDILRIDPENRTALATRTRLLAARKDFDALGTALSDHRSRFPDDSPALLDGARLLAASGEARHINLARSVIEYVLQREPESVDAHLASGWMAFRIRDAKAAAQAYRQVLARNPYDAEALNNLAWVLSEVDQDPAQALQYGDRGVERYPDNPHLLDTRGVILSRLGRFEEARRDLEKGLRSARDRSGTRARMLLHLAEAKMRISRDEEARADAREARSIDEQHSVFGDDDRIALNRILRTPGE